MLARVRALPGGEGAAAAGQIPLGGNYDTWSFHVQGKMAANPAEDPAAQRYSVTPGYFDVMTIPLLRGRLITEQDTAESLPVLLIGRTTAERLWGGGDPIGSRVRIGPPDEGPWRTVVGVVGDVQHVELAEPPTLQMYTPETQVTDLFLTLVVRSSGDPLGLAPAIRGAIREVGQDIPVYDVAPLESLVAGSVAARRFVMLLLSLFATLAVLMASVGIYGVVSYSVTQRTPELGVRMALGAQRADIVRLMARSGALTIGSGLAIGVGLAAVLSRFLEGILYGVDPGDPLFLLAGLGFLTAVSVGAYWSPVRRALRVDPVVALRDE